MKLLTAVAVLSGLLFAFLLMLMPSLTTWFLLVWTVIIAGPLSYFLGMPTSVQWLSGLLSMVLLARVLVEWLKSSEVKAARKPPPFFYAIAVTFVCVLITTMLNFHPTEAAVESKNMFQFIPIPFVFYFLIDREETADALMKSFLVIALLQVPISLLQRVISPGLDTITGTFGGTIVRPGPNSAFAMFLTAQTAVLIALALNKVISWGSGIILCLLIAVPIFLTNARAIIFFYALMLLFLAGKYFLRRPLATTVGSAFIATLIGLTLYLHYTLGWTAKSGHHHVRNFPSYIEESISTQLGAKAGGSTLNRTEVVLFWWQEHRERYDITKILFGHGLGSAKEWGLVKGHLLERVEYDDKLIGRTFLSKLLWEIGVVGTTSYFIIFVSAFFTARDLSKNPSLTPLRRSYLVGAQVACLIFLLSLPYKDSLIINPPFAAYSMFVLGYIAFWYVRMKPQIPEPSL